MFKCKKSNTHIQKMTFKNRLDVNSTQEEFTHENATKRKKEMKK